jgi:sugar phosphate isomerase/epimerase
MRRGSARTLACALVASAGLSLFAAAAAQAQRPEKLGNGIKTGQLGVQMFNYGGYISNGGNTGAANPITSVSAACATSTSTECRLERLEALFAFLRSEGVTNIELFGHAGFPASTDIAGLQAYRALMDEYGLHAGGWHGSMNEAQWDTRVNAAKILGADYIGSGGVADPGITTYAATLASAQALNRMGKKAVEAGVGPTYIHNHTDEFDRKYVENGVTKTAYEVIMDNTDPRYVAAELDVFWSSDAHDDVTGTASAAIINKYPTRVQLLHIKDGINITARGTGISSRGGSPRTTGTGELDFRPILTAANNRVRYYHQEHDGGTITDADTSLSNLKGSGPTSVGTLLALPVAFPAAAVGTTTTVPVIVQNTGEQPLTITNITIGQEAVDAPSSADFSIASQNCTAAPIPAGRVATAELPAIPRSTCTVQVAFKPLRSGATSLARLQFTSNSDDATERVTLVGKSLPGPVSQDVPVGGEVGGNVAGQLALSIPAGPWSFGTFVPGLARDYDLNLAAQVTSTAGNALLTVTDPSATATGYLVNGTFALASPLQVRSPTAANPNPAYATLPSTAGAPLTLQSYSGPVSSEAVQIALRQSIGANEGLRAGTYGKNLTFTLSSSTP